LKVTKGKYFHVHKSRASSSKSRQKIQYLVFKGGIRPQQWLRYCIFSLEECKGKTTMGLRIHPRKKGQRSSENPWEKSDWNKVCSLKEVGGACLGNIRAWGGEQNSIIKRKESERGKTSAVEARRGRRDF